MMIFSKKSLLFLFLFATCLQGASITYEFSGGRFGDNLLSYLHAKWISFKYKQDQDIDLPLFYKPFKYSDQLVLHYKEQHFDELSKKVLARQKVLTKSKMRINPAKKYWLYAVPYFSEAEAERSLPWNNRWIYFKVDWNNRAFKKEIQELIKPVDQSLSTVPLPKDCITVAMHIRTGKGFDGPLLSDDSSKKDHVEYADINVPLKFPPVYFYADQLKKISGIFDHQKIYAFIFTDDSQPENLANKLKKHLIGYSNIELDYRKAHNSHDENVLEDFFSLLKFDCLIRPQSNFSVVAGKLADYKIEISPIAHHWEGHKSIIDNVELKTNLFIDEKKEDASQIVWPFNKPMYFVTVADTEHYPWLIIQLNSIVEHNKDKECLTLVFDIGLTTDEIQFIESHYKAKVYPIEQVHPDLTKKFVVRPNGRQARGWYAWKLVAMKQALDYVPYFLYMDAGIRLTGPANDIFHLIDEYGYFFFDCGHEIGPMTTQKVKDKFNLHAPENCWILDQFGLGAGVQGISSKVYDNYLQPLYLLAHDIRWFEDDGTAPWGFGGARHDQSLCSIQAKMLGYAIYKVCGKGPKGIFIDEEQAAFNRNAYFGFKEYEDNPRAKNNSLI